MVRQAKDLAHNAQREEQRHPSIKDFITKLGKDNIGMLAGFVSWNILTSIVPIVVGLVFIASLFLRSPSAQAALISHLSSAMQGVLSPAEIRNLVKSSTQHAGVLGIIGLLGVFWGGSNVGGAISTSFQPIFEVNGRNFIKEKLIDIGMIFVFTALLVIVLAGTTAGAILDKFFAGAPLPGVASFVIGTAISLIAAFLLFAAIYLVFPNTNPHFRLGNVWKGALLSAVLFEILSYIWPIYTHFQHFGRYGAFLSAALLLTAWIYFLSMIMMLGAEVVAVASIRDAQRHAGSEGPRPNDSVPQHEVLRGNKGAAAGKPSSATAQTPAKNSQQASSSHMAVHDGDVSDETVEHDPAFWLLAATPVVVATLAGVYELLAGKPAARSRSH